MFHKIIRGVFLFAYGAFLYASLRHIAFFFHSFEPFTTDWVGSYALAISIDATALILTVGVMFFKKGMPWHAIAGVWFFIFCLTGFSWVVNWEYAVQFQSNDLSRAANLQWVNPVLASSFAFLNIAYSVIAELFNAKPKTVQELQQELNDLQQKAGVQQQLSTLKNQQIASWLKGKVEAVREVWQQDANPNTDLNDMSEEAEQEPEEETEQTPERQTDPRITAFRTPTKRKPAQTIERKVQALLDANPSMSYAEIGRKVKRSRSTISGIVKRLSERQQAPQNGHAETVVVPEHLIEMDI